MKAQVETTVEENLDEKKIKAMQGIINNPPEKIKLIMQAVACLNPTGTSMDFKTLFMKAGDLYKGIKDFMAPGGAGHKLKQANLTNSDG